MRNRATNLSRNRDAPIITSAPPDDKYDKKDLDNVSARRRISNSISQIFGQVSFVLQYAFKVYFRRFPKLVLLRLPWFGVAISVFVCYTGLQTLGLFWAFYMNVVLTLCLKFGELVAGGKMPDANLFEIVATCYSVYTTIVAFTAFGALLWEMSWHSFHEFPVQRKIILLDRHSRAVMFFLMLAMFFTTFFSLFIPYACSEVTASNEFLCTKSTFRFVSTRDSKVQRIMKMTTIVGLVQWTQILLYQVPSWNILIRKMRFLGYSVSMWGYFLLAITGVWILEWASNVIGVSFPLYSLVFNYLELQVVERQFAMFLILAWEIWFIMFIFCVEWPSKANLDLNKQDKKLKNVFKHMKFSFVVIGMGQFFRSCFHIKAGVLVAQEELAQFCVTIPLLYIILYGVSVIIMQLSWKVIFIAIPLNSLMSYAVYKYSYIAGPATFFMVFLHIFSKAANLYGDKTFSSYLEINVDKKESILLEQASEQEALVSSTGRDVVSKIIKIFLAIVAIFAVSMAGFSALSVLQDFHGWDPQTIEINSNENMVHIEHVNIIDLKLTKVKKDMPLLEKPPDETDMRYAICDYEAKGLGVVDYALLAELAYFDPDQESFNKAQNLFFGEEKNDFQIKVPSDKFSRSGHAQFFEVKIERLNLTVIAIRGTDVGRVSDIIEDVKMYMEPVTVAILCWIFPTIRIWPERTTSGFIAFLHEILLQFGLGEDTWYFNTLCDYVENLKKTSDVVLTGHSLGGGLARIVGALTNTVSIGFSSPGISHTYQKVLAQRTRKVDSKATKVNKVHHGSVNIVPENDAFSMVDSQAGLVQRILCESDHKALLLSCHMLESTLCELIKRCGDKRFSDCSYDYHLSGLLPEFHLAGIFSVDAIRNFILIVFFVGVIGRFLALP